MPIRVVLENRPVVGRAPVYSRCKQSCRAEWHGRFLWSPPFLHRWEERWSSDLELHRHSSGEKSNQATKWEKTSDKEENVDSDHNLFVVVVAALFLPASHSSSVWRWWSPVRRQWCGTLGGRRRGDRRGLSFWAASSGCCVNVAQTLTPVERLVKVLDLLIVTGFGQ